MRFWHSLTYIRDHHSPASGQVNIHRVMNTLGVMRQLITPYREFSGSVTQHHVAGYPARSRLSGTPQPRNNPANAVSRLRRWLSWCFSRASYSCSFRRASASASSLRRSASRADSFSFSSAIPGEIHVFHCVSKALTTGGNVPFFHGPVGAEKRFNLFLEFPEAELSFAVFRFSPCHQGKL